MTRKRPAPRFELRDPLLDATPADTLDLHGFRASEVMTAVEAFLRRQRPGAVVHVITGRGRGSPGKPVLGPRVRALLAGRLNGLVADYAKDLSEGGYLVRRR